MASLAIMFLFLTFIRLATSITWIANTTRQFNGATLNCISGEECKLYCHQYESCYYSTINCAGSTSCYVQCDNHDQYGHIGDGHACYQMNIYGATNSTLTIHVYDGSEQLRDSRIYVADNGPYGDYTTYLQCGIDTYYPYICYIGTCRYNTIYAVEGLYDINIRNAKSNCYAFYYGNKMYCNANYTKLCSSFSEATPISCLQSNSCGNYHLPSLSPTNAPSLSPSMPTSTPTINPSIAPSNAPSAYPTFPTIQPTFNPSESTLKPTNIPSTHPTENPTDIPITMIPTNMPSKKQTENPTFMPTFEDMQDDSNRSYSSILYIIIVMGGNLLFF